MKTTKQRTGFFWRDGQGFGIVILDDYRRVGGKKYCEEFRADSAEALIKICRAAGYAIGSSAKVTLLCETSPRWRLKPGRPRRRSLSAKERRHLQERSSGDQER